VAASLEAGQAEAVRAHAHPEVAVPAAAARAVAAVAGPAEVARAVAVAVAQAAAAPGAAVAAEEVPVAAAVVVAPGAAAVAGPPAVVTPAAELAARCSVAAAEDHRADRRAQCARDVPRVAVVVVLWAAPVAAPADVAAAWLRAVAMAELPAAESAVRHSVAAAADRQACRDRDAPRADRGALMPAVPMVVSLKMAEQCLGLHAAGSPPSAPAHFCREAAAQ